MEPGGTGIKRSWRDVRSFEDSHAQSIKKVLAVERANNREISATRNVVNRCFATVAYHTKSDCAQYRQEKLFHPSPH